MLNEQEVIVLERDEKVPYLFTGIVLRIFPIGSAAPFHFITGYYLNGVRHRLDAPAYIHHDTGNEFWLKYGIYHRDNGPAIKCKYPDGNGFHYGYWLRGKYFSSKEDWFEALNPEEKTRAIWNVNEWK
jgi:hypothetical protein